MQAAARWLDVDVAARVGWTVSVAVLLVYVVCALRATGRSAPETAGPPPRRLVAAAFGVFALAVATRWWFAPRMFGSWYFSDDAFDSCVMPLQLARGEPIWGGGTNYLTYLAYLGAYRLLGFAPSVGRLVNILVFAAAVAVFHPAVALAFGRDVARFMSLVLLGASGFFVHSVFPTAITFSLLPVALVVAILLRPIGPRSAAALGPILGASCFLYPAAPVTGAAVVGFHGLLCRDAWSRRARVAALGGAAIAGVGVWLARRLGPGSQALTQWGGGFLTISRVPEATAAVFQDLFWSSTTWNTFNLTAPYIDAGLQGFLLVACLAALPFRGGRWGHRHAWTCICLGATLATILITGMGGPYPGVRRAFSALPLLALVAALGWQALRETAPRRIVNALTVLAFATVALQSAAIVRSWPLSGRSPFMEAVRNVFELGDQRVRDVLLLAYQVDQYRAQHYRCALELDDDLRRHFGTVHIVEAGALRDSVPLPQPFVLFANQVFEAERLEHAFGRLPTRAVVRQPEPGVRADQLVAFYEFGEGS